jgi:hypothetical protein
VWDYDSGGPPILFDMQVRGQRVRAVAEASKNGYLYILNRETGLPVHPIKEMPVPTEPVRAGEHPWPTQPIPHKANGQPMTPVSPVFPVDIPPEALATRKPVPHFTPVGSNQISAPGTGGGANYSPISYSPLTKLLEEDRPGIEAARPARSYFASTRRRRWCGSDVDGFGQAGSSRPAAWCLWEAARRQDISTPMADQRAAWKSTPVPDLRPRCTPE